MTPRLLLVPLLLLAQAAPALAFSRVPVSLTSTSERAPPVAPRSKSDAKPAYVPKPVDPLQDIRKRMVNDAKVSGKELRTLADSGDDLAAFNYAKRMEAAGDPELLDTAARYYLKSLKQGRTSATRPLIRMLQAGALDEAPKNRADAQKTLDRLADQGNEDARRGMLDMYRAEKPFGPNPERLEQLVAAVAEDGDAQAALDLAVTLLSGTPDAEQNAKARKYLELAAGSETLGIRTIAENLLRGLDAPSVALVSETSP